MAKDKELMVPASQEVMASLSAEFPQEASYVRIQMPRFGMISQDKLKEEGTGKNKKITVEVAEGTFYTDRETENTVTREDGTEGKEWQKDYLDTENPEVIILFQRKQLRYYDSSEEKYTSSPIYDRDDEEVVLFKDRAEVARGTPAELKALYPGVDRKGKAISNLKEEKILYVLFNGELMQMNLKGTSLWSFQAFARKVSPPTVITMLGAEHCEQGETKWSKTTFTPKRQITADEAETVMAKIQEIKEAIASEKAYFAQDSEAVAEKKSLDEKFD